jgi:hypothetical protein
MESVTTPVLATRITLSKLITLCVQCNVGILPAKDVKAYNLQACNCGQEAYALILVLTRVSKITNNNKTYYHL